MLRIITSMGIAVALGWLASQLILQGQKKSL